jgi:hypothetical protein
MHFKIKQLYIKYFKIPSNSKALNREIIYLKLKK